MSAVVCSAAERRRALRPTPHPLRRPAGAVSPCDITKQKPNGPVEHAVCMDPSGWQAKGSITAVAGKRGLSWCPRSNERPHSWCCRCHHAPRGDGQHAVPAALPVAGWLVGVPGKDATGSSTASPASCFHETLTAAAAFCSSASTCDLNSSRVWMVKTC